jgi:transposase-like protein
LARRGETRNVPNWPAAAAEDDTSAVVTWRGGYARYGQGRRPYRHTRQGAPIPWAVMVVSRMVWYTAGDLSQERVGSMVHQMDVCRHCGSSELIKYGIAPNGKQKYRCRTCGRQSREYPGSTAYSTERKEEILRAYQERSSLRGLERTFGVARSTVISWLKKSPAARSTNTDAHSSSSARSTHDHTRTG